MLSNTTIWKFFASVKLALFTLIFLSVTSILGTVIPQKESSEFYIQRYGEKTATFLSLFDITAMYSSWWFVALLGLLSANLIICSIDRFPKAWRLITKDNLDPPLEKIEKIGIPHQLNTDLSVGDAAEKINSALISHGWKPSQREKDDALVLFSQKTPWSRVGVYIVHISILVIFAGAIFGQLTGFRGGLMLPELQSSNVVFPYDKDNPIPLDFVVRCERFDVEFYPNGTPKLFRSKLTLLKDDKILVQKDIEVNDPLKYQGITFYQASYKPYSDFIFSVAEGNQENNSFIGEFQKEIIWDEKNLTFGIINLESIRDRVTRLKIWFNDGGDEPSQFWMKSGENVTIERGEKSYLFSAKQRFGTGLQIAKDPGVWIVYLGCGLLLAGLYLAFFMSHQRIWFIFRKEGKKTVINLRGTTNKNKAGFEKIFLQLVESVRGNL